MFKAMDPALIRELIKDQTDTLSEEVQAEDLLFAHATCPLCNEEGPEKRTEAPQVAINEKGEPTVISSPFSQGRALPNCYAHCIHCDTDFNPYTGVIRRTEASLIAPGHPEFS